MCFPVQCLENVEMFFFLSLFSLVSLFLLLFFVTSHLLLAKWNLSSAIHCVFFVCVMFNCMSSSPISDSLLMST